MKLIVFNPSIARQGPPVVRLRSVTEESRQCSGGELLGETRLVERMAARDQEAIAELYDATRARVFGLALRILDDHAAAEDVVIEVFSQCWRQAHLFDPSKGTVMAWLFNLTRSRAIDSLRVRRRDATVDIDMAAHVAPTAEPDPSDASIHAQQQRIVRRALASLPPAQRQAIELAFYSGLSHSEIAVQLERPLGTVKTRIRDGMLKLREELGPLVATSIRRQA